MRGSNGLNGSRRAWWRGWFLLTLLVTVAVPRSLAQNSAPPRVVVIGDIHGDLDAFTGILRNAGIVDATGRWIAGNSTLVQTGDYTDRGPKVRAVMDLLMTLEQQAEAARGRVAVLLGNHEGMNLLGDGRDVTPAIYATFADERSEQRRQAAYESYLKWCAARSMEFQPPGPRFYQPVPKDDWMAAHPPGFVEYREAFGPRGRYGRWLRTKPAVLRLGDTVFLHAGINPDRAPRNLEDISKQVLAEVKRFDDYRSRMIDRKLILPFFTLSEVFTAAQIEVEVAAALNRINAEAPGLGGPGGPVPMITPDPPGLTELLRIGTWSLIDPEGPLWFRGFATWSTEDGAVPMGNLLQRYKVAHFVVGHTISETKRITPRFSGAVFLIDTGMLSGYVPDGRASALEIRDGRFTAIYADERTRLLEAGMLVSPAGR